MQACKIALLWLNPTPEWIHKRYKRKAYEHMLHRTQKASSCLLNLFPTSGKKKVSLYLNWELKDHKNEDWMPCWKSLVCFLISLRATGWFFNTAVSVAKCATLTTVLWFSPDDVTVSKYRLRKCKFPLFKHRVFIIVDFEDWRPSFRSLPLPSPVIADGERHFSTLCSWRTSSTEREMESQ